MRASELIQEGASAVLYHYTTAWAALQIVESGQFELAISTGSRSEQQLAPPGYPYFMSLTRTLLGDYHRWASNGAVMFNLDGTWFRGRYPVRAVDYWERSWNFPESGRTRESEDRVFSREPQIPADSIREVHVLLKEPHEHRSPQVRQLLIACKRHGLPAFLYQNEQAWRLQDRRRSIPITRDVTQLRGPQPRGYISRAKNYLEDWIELLHKKSTGELTRSADRLRYNLRYYGHPGEDQNLSVEISNARKPDSGASRRSAIEILNYMRSHDMHTTGQFRDWIAKKWDDIVTRERETKQATESAPPRSVATKQAMTTSCLYRNEDLIEQVWDMKRPRSLPALQAALDLLWDHYAERLGVRMLKPQLEFGAGVKYHGRYLSYTQGLDRGQKIVLAPGERNFYVLVHELSHALGPSQHGIRFARVYHDLLNHDTFKTIMSTPRGQEFLEYLRVEHPRQVRRIYRNR